MGLACSHASPASSFARGSLHFEEFTAKTSLRRSSRCTCSSTQKLYAFQSTSPGSRCGAESTRRFHDPASRLVSISATATFLRPISSGSDRNARSTGAPSAVASKSTTSTSSFKNGRTVENRLTSIRRHASSASESSGGARSTIAATAAASSLRGTTASIASHIAASVATFGAVISPVEVSTCSAVSSSTTCSAAASFAPARSTFGRVFNFSFALSRSARASSLMATSTSSRSSASSTALVVRCTAVASKVARRRASPCRRNSDAFPSTPYRDSSASRRGGTPATSTSPIPSRAISWARSSAAFICGPDTRTGPRRSRSSSETRAPAGTVSSSSNADRCPGVSRPCSVSHSRWFAASRTDATSRANRLTPGSSTGRSRSHPTAASNSAFGPSPVVQARASSHTTSSSRTSAKSRQPPSRWMSPACERAVPSRSPYSASTEASSIPSCSARYSATSRGTCRGSGMNRPRKRTVVSCTAKPSRLCARRFACTFSRSASSRKKNRSNSACAGAP